MAVTLRRPGSRVLVTVVILLSIPYAFPQAPRPASTTTSRITSPSSTPTTGINVQPGAQGAPGSTGTVGNTSTIAFGNALRVETPPGRAESWWRTPAAAALIAAGISLLNVIVVMWFNRSSLKQKAAELERTLQNGQDQLAQVLDQKEKEVRLVNRQKDIEEERRSIYKQLNEFYGPIRQLLSISQDLADAFKNGRDFRTLLELLNGTAFEGNDAKLLAEIIKVTNEIETLIMTKSGLVEDPELRETLSRAVAHFRILKLASTGALSGETARFKRYVFPRQDGETPGLEQRVDTQIAELRSRLSGLTGELQTKKLPSV